MSLFYLSSFNVSFSSEFHGLAARAGLDGDDLVVTYDGRTVRYAHAESGRTVWLDRDGHAWALTEEDAAPVRVSKASGADATIRAPMPGTVLAVHVTAVQQVTAGQPLAVIEAMKMEHVVTAPLDGVVSELTAKAGRQVGIDEPLAVIRA